MFPCEPSVNRADVSLADTVFSSDLILQSRIGTNREDLLIRQRDVAVPISARRAPFIGPISRVLGIGPKEEMIGIHAGANVAMMKNANSVIPGTFRNWSISEFPRNSVSRPRATVYPKTAIAGSGFSCLPQPTTVSPENLRPKTIRIISSHATSLGSVVRGAVRTPILPRLVHFSIGAVHDC